MPATENRIPDSFQNSQWVSEGQPRHRPQPSYDSNYTKYLDIFMIIYELRSLSDN